MSKYTYVYYVDRILGEKIITEFTKAVFMLLLLIVFVICCLDTTFRVRCILKFMRCRTR